MLQGGNLHLAPPCRDRMNEWRGCDIIVNPLSVDVTLDSRVIHIDMVTLLIITRNKAVGNMLTITHSCFWASPKAQSRVATRPQILIET